MQFLKATIPGEYLDGFLYRGHLYLLRIDSSMVLVNWDELVSARCPGPAEQVDPLAEMLFIDNSLARVDRRMLRWSGYPELRDFFNKRLRAYQDIDFSLRAPINPVDLGGRAVHSIELYFSHLWLAGEAGVSMCQYGPGYHRKGRRSTITPVISGHAFSATPERRFLWVSQRGMTIGFPIEKIASDRVNVNFGSPWELPFSALTVGWHWSDPTFASRDELRSRAFVYADWLEPDKPLARLSAEDRDTTEQRKAAVSKSSSDAIMIGGKKTYLEIELGDLARSRVFCSRERAIVQKSSGLTALDWQYDFSRSDLGVSEDRSEHGDAERVLISTFGWVVEGSLGVVAYTRQGCTSLAQGEVIQVRTFPSSIRYENIVLIVLEDRIEILSMLDYDFLLAPGDRIRSIGRRSEFYSRWHDDSSERVST